MNLVHAVRLERSFLRVLFFGVSLCLLLATVGVGAMPGAEDTTFNPGFVGNAPVNNLPVPGIARLKDDENVAPGSVEFTTNAIVVNETNASVSIGVRRVGGTNGLVTVNYGAAEQTASAGTDFVTKTGVIRFADGEAGEKVVTFDVLDDEAGEGNETFQLTLANPLGGVSLGPAAACVITLVENDTTVQMATNHVKVFEPSGAVSISITRGGVLTQSTRVTIEAQDGTASSGQDFEVPRLTVDFAPGETNKTIAVVAIDDFLTEQDEFVDIAIASATGASITPGQEATRIDISDNERPGSADDSFQQPDFSWWANGLWVRSMALQADGKIVVAGHLSSIDAYFAPGIGRLLPDGNRDPSFQFNYPSFRMPVTLVAAQPDGKILFVHDWPVFGQSIGRLNPDGSADGGFVASVDRSVRAMEVLASGKIVIAGRFTAVNAVSRGGIARLLVNGGLDENFAAGPGVGYNGTLGTVNAIARQSDGKWVIGGQFNSVDGMRRTNIARLYSNGTIDPSFDAGAVAGSEQGYYVAAVAIQPNGKILVGGRFDPSPLSTSRNLIRLWNNGTLDVNYNASGQGTDFAEESEISEIRIQKDGRALIAGRFTGFNRAPRNGLARLLWNGTLDTSFEAALWENPVHIYDMLLQPTGEIVVAGALDDLLSGSKGVARINPGILDFKFYDVQGPPNGYTSFRFQVPPGTSYELQRSSDLMQWRSVVSISNQTRWTDTNSALAGKRFYRAVRTNP